jgi:hypothetical protein
VLEVNVPEVHVLEVDTLENSNVMDA